MVSTLTTFSNTTVTDSTGAAGTYYYDACVYDLNNNVANVMVARAVPSKGVQTIFATSYNQMTGSFGGLSGANAICASIATGAGFSGTWKAIISDGATNANANVTISGAVYDVEGNKIASNSSGFWSGTLLFAPKYTEMGGTTTANSVMTGANSAGVALNSENCHNLTNGTASYSAEYGTATSTTQAIANST